MKFRLDFLACLTNFNKVAGQELLNRFEQARQAGYAPSDAEIRLAETLQHRIKVAAGG